MKSIHRVRVEDRGASRAEQERVTQILNNPQLTGDTTADTDVPLDLHTCWYDDDGNVQCSEDDW